MIFATPDARILQIHPTRFCNLRCAHCYSSSGPEERGELGAPLLQQAIRDAAPLGYNALTVSGGEPLLYAGLPALCHEAHICGMAVMLVTNGTRLTERRLDRLAGLVDSIAISIDGRPERHNRIRRAPGAFEIMEQRLRLLRRSRIPFGFVFTLMKENLIDLQWAADFAASQGAAGLQIHPLERHGRASTQFVGLPIEPADIAEWKTGLLRGVRVLGEIVSPLVIEADGTVVPLRYGFVRALSFGNLYQLRLRDMAAEWVRSRASRFCDVYRSLLEEVCASDRVFANVGELLSEEALRELTTIGVTPKCSAAATRQN
jgi:MoaA/NifB/PqqE/SkfB family radical SAM enzyme